MSREREPSLSKYLAEASKENSRFVLGLGEETLSAVARNIAQRLTCVGGWASSGIKKELIEKVLK